MSGIEGEGAISEATSLAKTGRIHFLVDQPADADFFGSHGRVASAIADVVREPGTANVIGLLGSWGSGKSTVIRQMGSFLESGDANDGVHLFTYDAWLHQSDPQRRAFLEALIANLTENGLIRSETWAPKLRSLVVA